MDKRKIGTLAAVAMLAFAACSGGGGGGASKGEIEIWSSLPRQGSSKAQTDTIVNAINMAIEEKGGTVGGYTIKYVDKDDSTAAAGKWDEATEIKNANDAVANDKLVAYIGTFNSGAAKLSIPILCGKGIVMISPANTGVGLTKPFEPGEPDKYYPNGCKKNYTRVIPNDSLQGNAGALWASKLGVKNVYVLDDTEVYGKGIVMISPANTGVGLTKPFEPGEPDKYYPNGCKKNYTRVIPNDSLQGNAGALWASKLGVKNVYVLDDTEVYGKGIADVFRQKAPEYGLTIVGNDGIDGKATDYKALAEKVKGTSPDLVYYGGITQNNAGQLWRDLRDAMPDVKLMGPDGVYENEFLEAAAAAAEGSYITFGGVPPDQLQGKGKEFVDKYTAKYPNNPIEGYTAYGYEAANVVLAAIERAAAKNPADVLALRALVLDEVKATKDYDGVLGKWSFDADGDTSLTEMSGLIVTNGEFKFDSVIK